MIGKLIDRFFDGLSCGLPMIPPPPPKSADFRPLEQKVADEVVNRLRREGLL